MTIIAELLGMVTTALAGPRAGANPPVYATDAQNRVFAPGDWPSQSELYPLLKLSVVRDTKISRGRSGPPQFITTTVFRIVGEVSAPAKVGDAGAADALAALLRLQRQVEVAIVDSYPLTAQIQQFSSINSQFAYEAGETHLAGIQIDLAVEYPQDAEDFAPIQAEDVDAIQITATNYPPAGFVANLQD